MVHQRKGEWLEQRKHGEFWATPETNTDAVEPDHHRHRDHPADRADGHLRRREQCGGGHVVTTILIAMVAMLFTAISYGMLARIYPSAGSAYTYVGQEIHPGLGYLTGWAMVMDYMLNPLICTILCSKLTQNICREFPIGCWQIFFATAFYGAESARSEDLGADQRVLAAGDDASW